MSADLGSDLEALVENLLTGSFSCWQDLVSCGAGAELPSSFLIVHQEPEPAPQVFLYVSSCCASFLDQPQISLTSCPAPFLPLSSLPLKVM